VEVEDYSSLKAGDDAEFAEFVDIGQIISSPDLIAFDHHTVIVDFLKSKGVLQKI
jgi:hypothetical protein